MGIKSRRKGELQTRVPAALERAMHIINGTLQKRWEDFSEQKCGIGWGEAGVANAAALVIDEVSVLLSVPGYLCCRNKGIFILYTL